MPRLLCVLAILITCFPIVGYAASQADDDAKITVAMRKAASRAGDAGRVAAWVYFADKGRTDAAALLAARANLTPRARSRRDRTRARIDAYDIPVPRSYVEAVSPLVTRIRHTSRWLNAVSVDVSPADLSRLASLSFVRKIDLVRSGTQPLPVAQPDDHAAPPPQALSPSALNYGSSLTQNALINVPPLHDVGYNGNGVFIAVLDAGFNHLEHEALRHLDIAATWDFVNGDSNVDDESGQMGSGNHGTWVLSTIAGFKPGQLIGPAWGATYALAKTENTAWERHIEEDAWVAAAEWADSLGADIITSSVAYLSGFTNGEPNYSWTDMDGNTTIVTIGADIAAGRGILVVNSAGNGNFVSEPANTLAGPADGDSVLAVGSVGATGVRSFFSSVGNTFDGRTKPDVMAMGENVRAASVSNPEAYSIVQGTSFSAPLTAGAAALLLEANPALTNMEIVDALRSTASQANSPDRLMGWGIVDATSAWYATRTVIAGNEPPIAATRLHPAYPNPFNPTTRLAFELASPGYVTLNIFNVRGQLVNVLVDEHRAAGPHFMLWNGTNRAGEPVSSGVYFYRLNAEGFTDTRKMTLVK